MPTADQTSDEQTTRIFRDPRIDAILQCIEKDDTILDIGCVHHSADKEAGEEHWLHEELCHLSDNVVGLDYLEEEVEELNERGYDVLAGDAESFSIGRQFNVIVAGELIEHLSNPGKFFERVNEHLLSGGKMILTTPNPWYARRFLEAAIGGINVNPEHTAWFDKQTLTELLNRYDLTVSEFRYVKAPTFAPRFSLMNIEATVTRAINRVGFRSLTGYSLLFVAEKS